MKLAYLLGRGDRHPWLQPSTPWGRRPGLATRRRNGVDDLGGRHTARQAAHVGALERPVRPQGDLDGLFTVRGLWRAVGGRITIVEGYVDDPEDDLRLGARAVNRSVRRTPFTACSQGSNTVTFGEVMTGGAGLPPVTGRRVFTAFGEPVDVEGDPGAPALPFIHVGYRWYDPATGRFMQRDPIGIAGGANTYGYCGNNPVNGIDPLGLWTIGIELEGSFNWGPFGGKFSIGIHIGWSRKRGASAAFCGSASANVGWGYGASIGPEVVITNADSTDDLEGPVAEININTPIGNGEIFVGQQGGWDGEPTRPLIGVAVGTGVGINVGANVGGSATGRARNSGGIRTHP